MSEQHYEVAAEPRQGARRYPRTFAGLIASMLVLVVGLVVFYLAQNATHDSVGPDNSAVPDWQSRVAEIQTVTSVAYPRTVPSGWTVTSADWDITDDPTHPLWKLGLTAPGNQFAGLYQQDAPVSDLVTQTIDKAAQQGADATVPTAVGTTWSTWTDSGGDHGYAAKLGSAELVVYGTSDAVVRQLMDVLTTAKLPASDQD